MDGTDGTGDAHDAGGMELLTLTQAGDLQGMPGTRVAQQVRDGQLVAITVEGTQRVPALFLQEGLPVKHLPGVIRLLRDGGYQDDEIVGWLFRPDDSLPGTPLAALRDNRGTEIKRRAQAAAF